MQKSRLAETITTSRLHLHKHRPDFAAAMFARVDQDRNRLRRYLPWVDSTKTIDDEKNYIAMTLQKWDLCELFDYGMYLKDRDLYIGNIGVHSIAWQHFRCEIGYWIIGDFEGQGLISEAVQELVNSCFAHGFRRVEIRCAPGNQRSAAVPRRCGFQFEGHLRQNVCESGEMRDTLVFARLAAEQDVPAFQPIGLDFVLLFSADVAKSTLWYIKVFGKEPEISTPDYTEFRIGTSKSGFAIHPADAKSPLSPGGSVAYWRVSDFDRTLTHLLSHGAVLYRGPLAIEHGQKICQIKDPGDGILGVIGPSMLTS